MAQSTAISPSSLAPTAAHFSPGVEIDPSVHRLLFVSGQLATDSQGEVVGIGAAVDAIHEALQFDLVGVARRHRDRRAVILVGEDREAAVRRPVAFKDGLVIERRTFERKQCHERQVLGTSSIRLREFRRHWNSSRQAPPNLTR